MDQNKDDSLLTPPPMVFATDKPVTFSDLAKQANGAHSEQASSSNNQNNPYGPTLATPSPPLVQDDFNLIHRQEHIFNDTPTGSSTAFSSGPLIEPFRQSTNDTLWPPFDPTQTTSSTTATSIFATYNAADVGLPDFRQNLNYASDNIPLYSPPPTEQPDHRQDASPKTTQTSVQTGKTNDNARIDASTRTAPGRIPKRPGQADEYDEMDLLTLQRKYLDVERRIKHSTDKRDQIERDLNDMARKAQGKNIELDPLFRQKKDEQKSCDVGLQEQRARLKRIEDKLLNKYNHRMMPSVLAPTPRSQPQSRQRAKMSTTSVNSSRDVSTPSKTSPNVRKYKFAFHNTNLWCQECDIHFNSITELCEHIHKRSHSSKLKHGTPWRTSKEPINQRKTYDLLKSICDKISNDIDQKFSIKDLDKVLNPSLRNDEQALKDMTLRRERGTFADNDKLFTCKGYDHLIPLSGFYCSLCDRLLADAAHVDQHMKSYEHSWAYTQSVAQNPQHEVSFRTRMERSYKEQFGSKSQEKNNRGQVAGDASNRMDVEQDSNVEKECVNPDKDRNNRSVPAKNLPAPSYKKSTSHIVDDHETIASLFSKKPAESNKKTIVLPRPNITKSTIISNEFDNSGTSKRRTIDLPDLGKRKLMATMPEIVPLSSSRTTQSALRQLRVNPVPSKKSTSTPPSASKTTQATSSQASTTATTPSDTQDVCLDDRESATTRIRAGSPIGQSPPPSCPSDSDVEFLEEVHLNRGDPDSPFPHLELCITGNMHMNLLKDKRLAGPCVVKMNRIRLEDYQDMLLESTNLWARVSQIMAKKESVNRNHSLFQDLNKPTVSEPTYFTAAGETIAVEVGDVDAGERDHISKLVEAEIDKLDATLYTPVPGGDEQLPAFVASDATQQRNNGTNSDNNGNTITGGDKNSTSSAVAELVGPSAEAAGAVLRPSDATEPLVPDCGAELLVAAETSVGPDRDVQTE